MALIIRHYICDNCGYVLKKEQDRDDPKRYKKCPQCKKNTLYQDLSGVYVGVREVKTVGQIADRNTKKLGRYGLQAKEEQEKNRQEQIYNSHKERLEKAFPNSKILGFNEKSPIPDTPSDVKKAIESQPTKEKKEERAKKYILEGK